jgi:hypothetical protein
MSEDCRCLSQVGVAYKLDRPYARLTLETLPAGEYGHALAELRIVLKVERDLSRAVAGEAGQAIFDVRGITDLGGLSIADDVDPDLDLLSHRVGNGLRHDAIKGGIEWLPSFTLEKKSTTAGLRANFQHAW